MFIEPHKPTCSKRWYKLVLFLVFSLFYEKLLLFLISVYGSKSSSYSAAKSLIEIQWIWYVGNHCDGETKLFASKWKNTMRRRRHIMTKTRIRKCIRLWLSLSLFYQRKVCFYINCNLYPACKQTYYTKMNVLLDALIFPYAYSIRLSTKWKRICFSTATNISLRKKIKKRNEMRHNFN